MANGGRALIADEMGTGKTVQALAIARHYRAEWPVLVVVPASLRFQWAAEAETWLGVAPHEVHVVFSKFDRPKAGSAPAPVTISSYRMVVHLWDYFEAQSWQVVILDESHHLRTPKSGELSGEARRARDLAEKAARRVLLSGTPIRTNGCLGRK